MLTNNKVYNLNHRAYFLTGNETLVLAASKEGNITIINTKNSSQLSLNWRENISDISFSESQHIISIIEEKRGNLVFIDFQGNLLSKKESPKFNSNYHELVQYNFLACYFDQYEKYFWCAALTSDGKVEIQLRQSDVFSIIDKIIVEDPFGDASFSFHPTNKVNFLSFWIAAGQDGQEIIWLEAIDNKIICKKEPAFLESTPPAFSPDGNCFLMLNDENCVCKYKYPTFEIGSCKWVSENEYESFDSYMNYLNKDSAIVSLNNGRVFLLDLNEMKILNELVIESHEPLKTSHYYPSLNDDELCTDLIFFDKLNDNIVFVYRQDKNNSAKGWKDSLIVIPTSKIITEFSNNQFAI